MEISLKQRLIGAAVLIALAVIFLPMFLDGAGRQEQLQMEMKIPPEPRFSFKYREPPAPEPVPIRPAPVIPPVVPVAAPPGEAPERGLKADVTGREAAAGGTRRAPKVQPEGEPAPASQSVRHAPAPEKPARPSAPKPVWVVQAGSFSKQANARVLLRRLVKDGFSAFVDEYRSGAKRPAFRVKVGPVSSKTQGSALKARLKRRAGIDGILKSEAPRK